MWSPSKLITTVPRAQELTPRSVNSAITNSSEQILVVQDVVGHMMPKPSYSNLSTLKSKLALLLPGYQKLMTQGQEGKREENKEGKDDKAIDVHGSEAFVGCQGGHEEYGLCRWDETPSSNCRRGQLPVPDFPSDAQLTTSPYRS